MEFESGSGITIGRKGDETLDAKTKENCKNQKVTAERRETKLTEPLLTHARSNELFRLLQRGFLS